MNYPQSFLLPYSGRTYALLHFRDKWVVIHSSRNGKLWNRTSVLPFFFLAIFLNPVTVQVALVVTGKGLSSPLTPPIPLDWMVRLLESGLMGTSALWVYEPLLPVKVPLTSPCLDQWFSKSVIQGHFCMTENSLKHLSPALSHLTYRGRKESPVWPWMRWHNEAILNGM